MQCKSLWIKASAKCINVNVNIDTPYFTAFFTEDFGIVVSVNQVGECFRNKVTEHCNVLNLE